jgi:hypothetical protein
MEPLFPELPEDLTKLSDDELAELLAEHEVALKKVEDEEEDYVGGLSATEILAGLEAGVEQIRSIKAEKKARDEASVAYAARKAELAALAREDEEPAEESTEAPEAEALAAESDEQPEPEPEPAPESEELAAEVEELAVVEINTPARVYRRPPATTVDRLPAESSDRAALVAAAGVDGVHAGTRLDRIGLATAMIEHVKRRAKPTKHAGGQEEKTLIASAAYPFPAERILRPNDIEGNNAKISGIGSPFLGVQAKRALVASGGLCAPLTPLYEIPDFASTARPVRGSLPSFLAERGGVSVPTVSTIGDIDTAITVIEESEDALGGTFATKSCQDMECPSWSDVAVGIISHCREYGNLNSRAWPEGIAHENNLTMAAHARTAEVRLLDRIRALSIKKTTAQDYGSFAEFVYAIARSAAGIRYRLRMEDVVLRALIPAYVPDLLISDFAATESDRSQSRASVTALLRAAGIEPAFYLDSPTAGTSQAFADLVDDGGALAGFPTAVQWALFIEGTFLHLDSGVLELGVVRDSTLNSTNDYQVFGETFENVARIGPAQAALWLTSTVCPTGEFPALATARSCS